MRSRRLALLLPATVAPLRSYRDELYDDLLRETDDVAARRKNAESLLELLKGASTIVNEVRDFNAFV